MRTRKDVVTKIRERGLRIVTAAALAASLGMLALGGCSSSQPPDAAAGAQATALNFSLEKCQPIEPNLYKCPAVDQPICTPQFTRNDINCVRTGPKGSVFVSRQGNL
jgi:hypothetical protein